jgi:signal transduction histidine kinase/CheY-like chemotaxis protein
MVPNFYRSSITGRAAITFATPLLDGNGVQMGAIAVDLDLQDIDRLIRENTGLGETAETYLVGKSGGNTVFMSRQDVAADNVDTLASEAGEAGEAATDPFADGVSSPGIDTAIAKESIAGEFRNYAGVPVVGVYRWLPEENVALVAEISQNEAFLPARQLARQILLIGLSSAGLLLVAVYLLSRRITQPILAIAHTAVQLADGNLNLRAPVTTEDETGLLARAFNQMTTQLRQSNEQMAEYNRTLEQRIEAATQDLQDTLIYLASIIDNMADGLLVTDPQGRIARFNPALVKMFQLTAAPTAEQPCGEVLGEAMTALVASTLATPEEVWTAEVDLGEGRIGKASATAIMKPTTPEAPETCIGVVILVQDITSEKEVDRMKTEFIATVSHELRTPLTSVLGFAKIIRKKLQGVLLPAIPQGDRKVERAVRNVDENIDIIISEGERLTKLINEVLDVAKMEAGRIDWQEDPLDMNELVNRAITATSSLFAQKSLQLQRDLAPDLPQVIGDGDRLVQVVINLLSNAVKFTPEGLVRCQTEHQGDRVIVRVTDSGVGIAPEDQPKVFEKFRQVGNTLTDKPQGTGLGLPICKQIVEHHGGDLWVDSALGEGSTFSFALPLAVASEDPILPDREALVQQLKTYLPGPTCLSGKGGKTVLVVDDDANIRTLLRQELEAEGYEVQEADNGEAAIAQVQAHVPNLIILDIQMPGIDGFQVAELLKSSPQTAHIPIIILSVFEDQERGYRLGVDRYFTKPMDVDQLLQAVGNLVTQNTLKKKVVIVEDDPAAADQLVQALRQGGCQVEAYSRQEFMTQVDGPQPDMVIASIADAEQHQTFKQFQQKHAVETLYFVLPDQPPRQTTDAP